MSRPISSSNSPLRQHSSVLDIEWPQDDEALSDEAVAAVELFLTTDPKQRPTAKEVHQMKFFESMDWNSLESVTPPFIPNPDNPTDTVYFEGMNNGQIFVLSSVLKLPHPPFFYSARNTLQHLKLSNIDAEDWK